VTELNSRSVRALLGSGGKYKYQRNACELSEWRKLESRGPWEGEKKNSVAKKHPDQREQACCCKALLRSQVCTGGVC